MRGLEPVAAAYTGTLIATWLADRLGVDAGVVDLWRCLLEHGSSHGENS